MMSEQVDGNQVDRGMVVLERYIVGNGVSVFWIKRDYVHLKGLGVGSPLKEIAVVGGIGRY